MLYNRLLRNKTMDTDNGRCCESTINVFFPVSFVRFHEQRGGHGFAPIKGSRCFLEQETLPLLLSTGWFQERIRA